MPMTSHKERISTAQRVIYFYRNIHPDYMTSQEKPDNKAIQNLLADLLYYADFHGLNVGPRVSISFEPELKGEA